MRISNAMTQYGFLDNLQKSLQKQNKLQEQSTDGKIFHRPSDDPVRVIRSMRYNSALVKNEQFMQNIKDADSWMGASDDALQQLGDVFTRAKELTIRGIKPDNEQSYQAIAKELDGLIGAAVEIANTKMGDRYLFAGQMDRTKPFERRTLTDPKGESNLTIDAVVYYGDTNRISMLNQEGGINVSRDGINIPGIELFGYDGTTESLDSATRYGQATAGILNDLIRVKKEFESKAVIQASNRNGGQMTLDGTYTGPKTPEFQDYAVKIDGIKVDATQTLVQAGGAGLGLTNRGAINVAYKGSLPAPAIGNIQVDVTSVSVASAGPPAVPAGRVESMTVSIGGVAQTVIKDATAVPPRYSIDLDPTYPNTNTKMLLISVDTNANNLMNDRYTLTSPTVSATGQAGMVSYSTDYGSSWTASPQVTGVSKTNGDSGDMLVGGNYTALPKYEDFTVQTLAYAVDGTTSLTSGSSGGNIIVGSTAALGAVNGGVLGAAPGNLRIDSVDSGTGRVRSMSYKDNTGAWVSATPDNDNPGYPTRFTLGASNLVVAVEATTKNQAGSLYDMTATTPAAFNGAVAMVKYATVPSNTNATIQKWDVGMPVSGSTNKFVLADGMNVTMAANAANLIGDQYSFKQPPYFDVGNGLKVKIDDASGNRAKDAYNFHVPQIPGGPYHSGTPDDSSNIEPDLEWLSADGLKSLENGLNQILKVRTANGAKQNQYQMSGNVLENNNVKLNDMISSVEDIDLAKAFTDLKMSETSYRTALAVGARIMPVSLVDFLN